ncbi:hypothetical protein J6590_020064 [Homalodisca vitripennis]|nr:hypothetical protein J6590_020064 [Homalodisca vitripennis]
MAALNSHIPSSDVDGTTRALYCVRESPAALRILADHAKEGHSIQDCKKKSKPPTWSKCKRAGKDAKHLLTSNTCPTYHSTWDPDDWSVEPPKLQSCQYFGLAFSNLVFGNQPQEVRPIAAIVCKSVHEPLELHQSKTTHFAFSYPKAGNRDWSDPTSLRPISLLICLGKPLERIMCTSRMNHIQGNGLLCDSQYSFGAGGAQSTSSSDSLPGPQSVDGVWWLAVFLKLRQNSRICVEKGCLQGSALKTRSRGAICGDLSWLRRLVKQGQPIFPLTKTKAMILAGNIQRGRPPQIRPSGYWRGIVEQQEYLGVMLDKKWPFFPT